MIKACWAAFSCFIASILAALGYIIFVSGHPIPLWVTGPIFVSGVAMMICRALVRFPNEVRG